MLSDSKVIFDNDQQRLNTLVTGPYVLSKFYQRIFHGALAIIFVIDVVITTFCMYFATKLAFVRAQLKSLMAIIVVVSVLSLFPRLGWTLGLIGFVFLLMQVSDARSTGLDLGGGLY